MFDENKMESGYLIQQKVPLEYLKKCKKTENHLCGSSISSTLLKSVGVDKTLTYYSPQICDNPCL